MLEETLGRLQARLQELENPQASQPILLANPYNTGDRHGDVDLPGHREPIENWWDQKEPPVQMKDML